MKTTAIAICALVLLASGPLSGATLRFPSQYASIQAAIDGSASGDTILVESGTYISIASFVNRDGITLRSESGKEATTIDGTLSWHGGTIYIRDCSNIRIEGFTIQSTSGANGAILVMGGSDIRISHCSLQNAEVGITFGGSVEVTDNTIHECVIGISIGDTGTYLISRNEIFGCSNYGIQIASNISGTYPISTISYNRIYENPGTGIYVMSTDGSGSIVIDHNTISKNSKHGIEHQGGYPTTISNNTIAGNSMIGLYLNTLRCTPYSLTINSNIIAANENAGISVGACSNPYIACNDVWGNSHYANGNYVGYITDQTGFNGNISTDPYFCNASGGVYSLAANSPALHASCGSMGAILTPGCSNQTAVEHLSWGSIKALYKQ